MKNFKKVLSVATFGVMLFGLVACGNKDKVENTPNNTAKNEVVDEITEEAAGAQKAGAEKVTGAEVETPTKNDANKEEVVDEITEEAAGAQKAGAEKIEQK